MLSYCPRKLLLFCKVYISKEGLLLPETKNPVDKFIVPDWGDCCTGLPGYTLQRENTEISKQIFPELEWRGLSPNFHIHASVSDLYNPMISLPILLEEICRPILGLYKLLTDK
jgi:hypothetical protein